MINITAVNLPTGKCVLPSLQPYVSPFCAAHSTQQLGQSPERGNPVSESFWFAACALRDVVVSFFLMVIPAYWSLLV